jgi:hypothetical protein
MLSVPRAPLLRETLGRLASARKMAFSVVPSGSLERNDQEAANDGVSQATCRDCPLPCRSRFRSEWRAAPQDPPMPRCSRAGDLREQVASPTAVGWAEGQNTRQFHINSHARGAFSARRWPSLRPTIFPSRYFNVRTVSSATVLYSTSPGRNWAPRGNTFLRNYCQFIIVYLAYMKFGTD